MRKRKRQLVLYLILIFLLSLFYMQTQQMYPSSEKVFYACERGLRYPKSEEIVLEFEAEEKMVVVGRQEDGLFVVPVVRRGLFWQMASGGVDGFFACENPVNGYRTYGGKYLGLCLEEEIAEVSILLEDRDGGWREVSGSVTDGLIFLDAKIENGKEFVVYTEGRNENGEICYQEGETEKMEAFRRGEDFTSPKQATVFYPAVPIQE